MADLPLVAPDPSGPSDPQPAIPLVDHLLFHKALHSTETDSQRLDEYIELATNLDTAHHIHTIPDSFTRTVGLLFSLVMEKEIDPWDLDLMTLMKVWEKEMAQREDIDFILAGNLIVWAWSVIKLRVEQTLLATMPVEEVIWDDEEGEDWGDWGQPQDFVTLVQQGLTPPLDEKVRHKGHRKVTLMELLDSLEQARRYVKLRTQQKKAREQLRKDQAARWVRSARTIAGRLHEDDAENDNQQAWTQLCDLTEGNGKAVPFTDMVAGKDKEGLVRTFLALLFLAGDGKVKLWQRTPPRGQIMVRRLEGNGHKQDDETTPGTGPGPMTPASGIDPGDDPGDDPDDDPILHLATGTGEAAA